MKIKKYAEEIKKENRHKANDRKDKKLGISCKARKHI